MIENTLSLCIFQFPSFYIYTFSGINKCQSHFIACFSKGLNTVTLTLILKQQNGKVAEHCTLEEGTLWDDTELRSSGIIHNIRTQFLANMLMASKHWHCTGNCCSRVYCVTVLWREEGYTIFHRIHRIKSQYSHSQLPLLANIFSYWLRELAIL